MPQLRWARDVRSSLTWMCDGPDSGKKHSGVCSGPRVCDHTLPDAQLQEWLTCMCAFIQQVFECYHGTCARHMVVSKTPMIPLLGSGFESKCHRREVSNRKNT